jgi:hypothetical protein
VEILKNIFSIVFKVLKWLLLTILLILCISAIYNQFLPEESVEVEYLSKAQKGYISEAFHLQSRLGDEIFPNWSDHSIPIIVYNEKYAFLTGMKNPDDGWRKMPANTLRGEEWNLVQSDDFFGDSYYRQRLNNPEITPENFTVKVGDQWVATLQTREYAEVAFYNGFKEELPAVVSSVFPYKIFWNLIMGNSENYVVSLIHESFHALQGIRVPGRLSSAEYINSVESQYPWENKQNQQGWTQEGDILIKAYQSSSGLETRELINRFLEVRENRRMNADLTAEEIMYEKEREWLEGMAKYAELKMGLIAEERNSYTPEPKLQDIDSDFNSYQSFESYFENQVAETKRAVARDGESRFYYTGMLQAMLLDRVGGGWKSRVFQEGVYLDDLLSNSTGMYSD